ncbi:unnamed protein product, partial [Didymodactylos carnosus]
VTYMAKRSQNEFISLIDDSVLNIVLNEAKQAPYFSIIADSTPDSSRQD